MTATLTFHGVPSRPHEPLLFDPHDTATTVGRRGPATAGGTPSAGPADVEIVVPVYNEEAGLERSITRLHTYLQQRFPLRWVITIADNASTDRTWMLACRLAQQLPGVRAVHLDAKGRGRALRAVWARSTSPVVAYMDVDLSTDLDALLPLVAPLLSGHSDLAIGTRLARSARVARGPRREAISRTYNLILKATLHAGFSDAQCGFKAARTDTLRDLLPLVQDEGWFFDTELLVLAEHNGLRIHEVPVDWIDDPDSRVHVVSTASDDLRGVWRLVRTFAAGGGWLPGSLAAPAQAHAATAGRAGRRPLAEQAVRFASIGVVSTVAFAALFAALVGPLGAVPAAVVALTACTLANTAANRRLTFALRGGADRGRHHGRALAVNAIPLALNLAALAGAAALGVTGTMALVAVLTAANAVAALARFALLDRWVFADPAPR